MSNEDTIEDIEAALALAFSKAPEAIAMVEPAARRAREKRMRLSPTDGRRARRTGRTAQFNVKIRADLKTQVVRASRDHRLLISELVEQALTTYLATLGARHG
jgi:hypothetical protein